MDEISILIQEVKSPTLGLLSQILEVHEVVQHDGEPVVILSGGNEEACWAYFPIEYERFHLVVVAVRESLGPWTPVNAYLEAHARISLQVASKDVSAQSLRESLPFEPTSMCVMGEFAEVVVGGRRITSKVRHEKNVWTFALPDGPGEVPEKLRRLLEETTVVKPGLAELGAKVEVTVGVTYVGHMAYMNGFDIPGDIVQMIGELGASLCFDLNASGVPLS